MPMRVWLWLSPSRAASLTRSVTARKEQENIGDGERKILLRKKLQEVTQMWPEGQELILELFTARIT